MMDSQSEVGSSRWRADVERYSPGSRSSYGSSSSIIASPSKKRRLDPPNSTPLLARGDRCVHVAEVEGLELGYDDQQLRRRVTTVLKGNGLQPVDVQDWLTTWWRRARSGKERQFAFIEEPPGRFEVQAWLDLGLEEESDKSEWSKTFDQDPDGDTLFAEPIPEDGRGMLKALLLHASLLLNDQEIPETPPELPGDDRLLQLVPVKVLDRAFDKSSRETLVAAEDTLVELLIPVHLPKDAPVCQGQSTPKWLQFEHHSAASPIGAPSNGQAQPILWTPEALITVARELARLSSITAPQGSGHDRLSGIQIHLLARICNDERGDVISVTTQWSQVRRVRWLLAQLRVGGYHDSSSRSIFALAQTANLDPAKKSDATDPDQKDAYDGSTASESSFSDTQPASPPPQGVLLPVRNLVSGHWVALC